MATEKKLGENLNLEGRFSVKEAADLQISSLNEEPVYLEATAKSVLSHIRKLTAKLKALEDTVGALPPAEPGTDYAYPIVAVDAYTTSSETNVTGIASASDLANEVKARLNTHFADAGSGALDSAITLANALKVTMNLHLNDQGPGTEEHKAKTDQIDADDATDLTTLITLTTELLAVYAAHDDDAIEIAPILHQATGTEKALVSADAPTNLHLCVTRLNDLKTKLNDHMDDATAHTDGDTTQNATAAAAYVEEHIAAQSAISTPNATDLATLKTLIDALLTAYDAHDADAELPAGWTVHIGQEAGDASLTSAVAPTTLAECITRINDLKAKLNTHMADGTGAHVDGNTTQVSGDDAAAGAIILVPCVGAQADDQISWSILNDGSGNVTGVEALATTDAIQFTFSGDPGSDTIISYIVVRPAAV